MNFTLTITKSLRLMKQSALVLVTLLAVGNIQAAIRTWNGNTDGTWNTTNNWNEGALDVNNTPTFGAVGNSGAVLFNDTVASSVAGITLGTSGYTIGGNSITLGGNISVAGTQNLNFDMTLGATPTISGNDSIFSLGGVMSGSFGITRSGNNSSILLLGNLSTFSGLNTYTGVTTLNNGYLVATKLADGGSPSSIGQSGNSATNLLLGNGTTFMYRYGGAASSDRGFTINGSSAGHGAVLDASGMGALVLTSTASPAYGATAQTRTLTLAGLNTSTNTLAANIANNGGSAVSLTKSGIGTWMLSGSSSYTGVTTLSAGGGTLSVASLANGGSPSSIGQSANSAANLLLGNGTTLKYTGSGASTDRSFTINGTGAGHGATLDASGTGALNLAGTAALAYGTTAQTRTLTLGGISTSTNSLSAPVANNGGSATSLTKAGVGSWILNGPAVNTYTGATTVNLGTLTADFGNLGTPTDLINNGGSLVLGGGTLSLQGKNSSPSSQTFATGTAVTFNAGGSGLSITGGSGSTMGLTVGNTWTRNAGSTVNVTLGTGGTLTSGPGVDTSTPTPLVKGSGNIAFATVGGADWAKVSGGTVVGFVGGDYNTTFPVSGASSTVNYSLTDNGTVTTTEAGNTLKINTTTTGQSLGITAGQTLTLTAGGLLFVGANDYSITGGNLAAGGSGELVVHQFGNGNLTIGSTVGAGTVLTKSGTNTLTLAGANTHTGNTYLNAGTLNLKNVNALQNSTLTMNGGSLVFDSTVIGNAFNMGGLAAASAGPGLDIALQNNAGSPAAITLTNGNNNLGTTYAGVLSGGGSLVKVGTGSLALSSGLSTYTGKTIVQGGTLSYNVPLSTAGNPGPLGAPTGANATIDLYPGTTFLYGGGQASTPGTIPYCVTDRPINLAGAGSGTVTLNGGNINDTFFRFDGGFTATGSGARTLLIKAVGDRPQYIYNGGIPDMANGNPVTVSLAWSSTSSSSDGKIYLNGVNTFTGPLLLTGGGNGGPGTVFIGGYNGGAGSLGSGSYAGAITFAAGTFASVVLDYASPANQTLSGVISGPGALTMDGPGTLTLSNANTFLGTTTLRSGKLALGHNLALQNSLLSLATAGTLASSVTTPTIGGLSGSRDLASVVTSGYSGVTALTLNPQPGVTATYTGVITNGADGMTLTKSGFGTQVFGKAQTYSGATTISAGTLQLGTGVTAQNGSVASTSIVVNALLAFNNFDAQTYSGKISGTGLLIKNGAGKLSLSGTDTYTGPTYVNAGILQYDALSAIAGSGRNIMVSAPGAVSLGYAPSGSIQSDLLSRIVTTSTGALALTNTVSENFDFSSSGNGFTALSLGANGTATYTGTLTPNGSNYRLGGGGGTLTFSPAAYDNTKGLVLFGNGNTGIVDLGGASQTNGAIVISGGTTRNGTLAASTFTVDTTTGNATVSAGLIDNGGSGLTVSGTGTLTLSGANTYAGTTTIKGGTLTLNRQTGALNSATALTFAGNGTFNLDNVGASGALSQSLGMLTFSAGEDTVKLTRTVALDELLTFSSLAARTAGASGSFVLGAGTASAANGFVITAQGAGFIDKGVFFGPSSGSNYAWYDAGGFVRAYNYAADLNGVSSAAGALISTAPTYSSAGPASIDSSSNVKLTGAISAQTATSINTLFPSTFGLAISSGTLNLNGILKAGNNAGGTISGGTLAPATSGGELVIRTDQASDTLTINSVIANNTNPSSVTKSGAGDLSLSGNNSFTGGFTLNTGILRIGDNNALGTGPITIYGGTFDGVGNFGQTFPNNPIAINGSFSANNNANANFGSGNVTLGGSYTINVTRGGLALNGVISDGGNGYSLTKAGSATLYFGYVAGVSSAVLSTYSGKTIIKGGTLVGFISPLNVAGVLGKPTTVANGTIDMYNGTILQFSPGGASANSGMTDRLINLADAGAGTVTVTPGGNNNSTMPTIGGFTITGTGSKTLQLLNTGNAGIMYVTGGIPDASDGSPTTVLVPYGSGNNNEFHIAGVSSFTGPLTLGNASNKGLFQIDGTGKLGNGNYANNISLNGSLITFNYASSADQILSGVISGSGALTKSGSGSLTLSGANTFFGVTTVSTGTLTLTNNLALQNSLLATSSGAITLSSGISTPTFGGLTGSTALSMVVASGYGSVTALTLNPQSGATPSYSGVIADGAANMTLTKSGLGTQTLTGANAYSGGTTVSVGTLAVGTGGSLGSGNVTVAAGGTLSVSGTGTLGSGDVSVAAGGALSLSTSSAISNTKRLTLVSGSVVNIAATYNETVNELYIDGKLQKKGKWGSSASSPTPDYIDNARFIGTGILTVLTGKPDGTIIRAF